jgi:hypothetical protein
MSSTGSTVSLLSSPQQKFEAQDVSVNLDKRGELIKVYCNNVFVGIAIVEKNKGELQIPPHIKESIKIMTSTTEKELQDTFKDVVALEKDYRTKAIDDKLSSILLFIEQFSVLSPHITHTDVDNLVDQIEKLESQNLPDEVTDKLTRYREIITAFKIDRVLNAKPVLERNNDFNIRFYHDKMESGWLELEHLSTVLQKTEEGPILSQLTDLETCGKVKCTRDIKVADLKHGDVVYFERNPKEAFGAMGTGLAVVDKLDSGTSLRVKEGDRTHIFPVFDENCRFTRVTF